MFFISCWLLTPKKVVISVTTSDMATQDNTKATTYHIVDESIVLKISTIILHSLLELVVRSKLNPDSYLTQDSSLPEVCPMTNALPCLNNVYPF